MIPNSMVERNPAAAQLYIVPVHVSELFSTHPATEKHIVATSCVNSGWKSDMFVFEAFVLLPSQEHGSLNGN